MAQAQCPNCGGYKVSSENKLFDSKTKQISNEIGIGLYVIAFLGTAFFVYIPSAGFFNSSTIGIVAGVFAGILILYISEKDYKKRLSTGRLVPINRFQCHLCGYRWDLRQGDPWPEIKVRPDLIAAGEQRLQDEAARRRHEEEMAYIAQQQSKK